MNESDQGATLSTDRTEEPQRKELHVQEQLRLAALIRDVGLALIQSTSLQEMMQHCAEALVAHFDAAFARIWTFNTETQVLELQASAGLYTHLNGPHSRIPMGTFKIGLIASERLPHLTNAVLGDPRVSDQEWARREGMVAFAGYPLLVADNLIGVMALFARHTLSPSILDAMASVANTIAIGIDRKQGELERIRLLYVEQQARQAAEEAQQRLIGILDHLPDGFMIFDTQWRYNYINPQAEPFTGKPRKELLGKNVWEEFPNLTNSTFYQQYSHAIIAQEAVSFRIFSQVLANWFDVRAYPIVDGLAVYFRPITEQVQAEEEKRHLLEAAQQAHIEAEAALSLRNSFLSSVSHDLRTPLATIKANLQLVQRRIKREQSLDTHWLSERLEAIERSITKMTGMIEDLLDLGRLQTTQLTDGRFRTFDLLPVIHLAVTEQQTASKRHQLLLRVGVESLPVSGNAPRLDRMLMNLLGNAVKYSPQGGEIIIEVTQEDQAWAHLSIQDHGVGIPQADLPHIFEPFHRASNVIDHIQGTGVGLASVAQVIEQHQGTISVTSEEGRGSCFTVRLPLVSEAPAQ